MEPVRSIYDALVKNYAGIPGLSFENSAIDVSAGVKRFYRVKSGDGPLWQNQIGSLSYSYYKNYDCRISDIQDRIFSEEVNCITFDNLMQKYNIQKIDILLIDAEGYDFKIIRSINFDNIKPRIIIFEHQTIYLNWRKRYLEGFWQYIKCCRYLTKQGYKLHTDSGNTTAILYGN